MKNTNRIFFASDECLLKICLKQRLKVPSVQYFDILALKAFASNYFNYQNYKMF